LILTFKKYSSLSAFKFGKEFEELAAEDESMPMIIYELGLYKKITHISWFEETVRAEEIDFPHALPFSTIYPMTCAQVRNYMNQQNLFLKDYYKYELPSLNLLVIENIDSLFTNTINKHFREKVDSLTREELAQNLINLEYFVIMTKKVSKILSSTFESEITLKSTELITNTRKVTEGKLFEVVDGKIDDLIEFIDWDWEAQVVNREPNYFIKDIGDFLVNMFNSTFKNLPISVRTILLYRVFDLLAARFFENLNAQRSITKESIHNFGLDVSYIEGITNDLSSTDVADKAQSNGKGSTRESLKSMFLQLRQIINLLQTGSLEEYRDQNIRNRKYDQVKPEVAIQLINKIEGSDLVNSAPTTPTTNTSSAAKIFSKFRNTGA
jgi:hypothetical protein